MTFTTASQEKFQKLHQKWSTFLDKMGGMRRGMEGEAALAAKEVGVRYC